MANIPDENGLRNFREFLEIYNQMSEKCFNRCILTLQDRDLSQEEGFCVTQCAEKTMRINRKMLSAFMVEQPKIMEQKAEAAQKDAEATMKKLQEQGVDVTKLSPEEMAQRMMENMQTPTQVPNTQ